MNYKQKALDHVRSVCPELMELSEGCIFEYNYDYWHVNMVRRGDGTVFAFSPSGDIHDIGYVNEKDKWQYKYQHFTKEWFEDEKDEIKIIGHTPHLEDFIRVVRLHHKNRSGDIDVMDYYDVGNDGEHQPDGFYRVFCNLCEL